MSSTLLSMHQRPRRRGLASLLSSATVFEGARLASDPHVMAARDRQFVGMLRAFREHGGLARSDEAAAMARQAGAALDASGLARRMASREILNVSWRHELWVPLFQFESVDLRLRESAVKVMTELHPVFDAWGVAHWFATPNGWLQGRVPVSVLQLDAHAVWQSARADRFIAKG